MGGIDSYYRIAESHALPYDNGNGKGTAIGYDKICSVGYNHFPDPDGSGIAEYNGHKVHHIDGYYLYITHVHGPWATGEIIKNDLTTQSCYIGRLGSYYVVAGTLREVFDRLRKRATKRRGNIEDIAQVFCEAFPDPDKEYKWGDMLFVHSLHPYSCEQGRTRWTNTVGYGKEDRSTVWNFLEVADNSIAQNLIRRIKEKYISNNF